MKNTNKVALTVATLGLLTLASTSALADTTSQYNTDADIELRDMNEQDPENPLIDPNDPGREDTVFPGDPDNSVHPNGPLVIDYISRYHFGEVATSGNNATYNAKLDLVKDTAETPIEEATEVPNFIQVTDNRGSNAGWTLGVRMVQEFTTADNKTLDNTTLSFKNTEAFKRSSNESFAPSNLNEVTVSLANTAVQTVASAKNNEGIGSWAITQGHVVGTTEADASKSVELFVPGKSKKEKKAPYTAKIEWVLTDAPGN